MNDYAINLTKFGRHQAQNATPKLGTVKGDHIASFTDLEGEVIRCTSGSLWVTLENDVMDHILRAEQSFPIPTAGKVIIGGKGSYRLEPNKRMSLAS
jgi:hypothetical protein